MATRNPEGNDASLPFAALELLAPPVRLVSAALWRVMGQRDVMRYGVVEEFVTSACETVPGLLTVRHQGKLALGLRGRLILELCSKQPDENVIMMHLGRIRAPVQSSSAPSVRKDLKIQKTVESFQLLVQSLLTDPAGREQFFKEEFPVDYGPKFDQELEKLLWEFLIRVDQLLPVPSLAQTVSWLSDTPSVLEECAQAATQPQLLKILLQHQTCLGHLETAASLPPNMGDSILASLSLPPSGRVPSDKAAGAKKSAVEPPDGAHTDKTPFITPVIGIISNDDVPVMLSAKKKTNNLTFTVVKQRQNSKDGTASKGSEEVAEERSASKRASAMKRKQPDTNESDEEEEALGVVSSGKKRMSKSLRNGVSTPSEGADQQSDEDGAKPTHGEECNRGVLETCPREVVENRQGVQARRLPEHPHLSSIIESCLRRQPRVVLEKQPVASAQTSGRAARPSYVEEQRRTPPPKPDSDNPGPDDKENYPKNSRKSVSPSQQRSNTETRAPPGHVEDYVGDSEDEATKNFKGRLFMRRYYKTKHGTYVPTLREYWKPGMTRRDLLSAHRKHR